LTYQLHSSSADCARELYKPSKDLANLRVFNEKQIFGFGFRVFVSDVVTIGKARVACAQSFALWQQATIELT